MVKIDEKSSTICIMNCEQKSYNRHCKKFFFLENSLETLKNVFRN